MRTTSTTQYNSSESGSLPPLEQVREDVWALAQPMARSYLPYSFTYLLRDTQGGFHVIDPGSDSDENWANILAAFSQLDASPADVRTIIGTHLHPDHIGMMQRLREASDATTQMHFVERQALSGQVADEWGAASAEKPIQWGVPDDRKLEIRRMADDLPRLVVPKLDQSIDDGEKLQIEGFDITVMLTAGHTSGHICLRDDSRSLMYSGDHVLPTIHAGLGLGGKTVSNPLADYLESLERVSEYPDYEVLPGHGYRFVGIAERAAASAEHHLRRVREVADVIGSTPELSTWQIASQLTWTAGWENLKGFYVYSALAQTDYYREYVENLMVNQPNPGRPIEPG
ncbi:MBL fold metallo-hydrolase [Microbacterium profundi]|nr:MBL fold metallo-hydrolase [Microbacterium profundi]MCE7483414.1 MBL fold metallo-hydrolase [Microbacterium profundi]